MSATLFLLFISYPSYPFSFGSVGPRVQSTYLTSTSCESVIERIQRVGFLFLLSRSELQVRRREDLQSASQKRMSRTTTNGRKLKRIKVYGTKMMLNQALFFLKNAPGTPLPSSCCQMDSWFNRLLFQYLNFLKLTAGRTDDQQSSSVLSTNSAPQSQGRRHHHRQDCAS